ncbi:MAG: methyltransferase domain-containing protein [Opitutaceae bacterium]
MKDIAIGTERYRALIEERRRKLQNRLAEIASEPKAFVFELGAGHGHFLTAYARKHPDTLCIGVDIASDRVVRAQRKCDRGKLANLHFLHTDAWLFLETLPAGLAIADVFVLFPDPWPKSRHHKHRIMQSPFLDLVATRASATSRFFFRTDFAPYFEHAQTLVRAHARWQLTDEPWPFECETVFQNRSTGYQSLVARRRS